MIKTARAFAKINLALRVLGRRPDGYHEIDTLLQTVDLHDRLTFRPAPGGRLEVACGDPGVPEGAQNLVWKALDALRREAGRPDLGMAVSLEKGIPTGSGLGGGSSDAACALAVGAAVWGLNLAHEDLEAVGARIGSDVPFFIRGGVRRATGRGEVLSDVEPIGEETFGLLIPPVRISTGSVYGRFRMSLTANPVTVSMVPRFVRAGRAKELADLLVNDLESITMELAPELVHYKDCLRSLGIPIVRMTGSGSAFYFWPLRAGLVDAAREALAGSGCRVLEVRTTQQGWIEEEVQRQEDTG